MTKFQIIPLSETYAASIRTKGVDDFGHPLITQLATGKGPCRISLQPFVPGIDERILLAYSPFEMQNAFNQSGPIFISKKPIDAYRDVNHFPPAIKADKENFPLTFIGYNKNQQMIFTKLLGDADPDELIPEIYDTHARIEYLHVRNAEAGCFICKIVRAD